VPSAFAKLKRAQSSSVTRRKSLEIYQKVIKGKFLRIEKCGSDHGWTMQESLLHKILTFSRLDYG
jgi:hypothetical protein